ncbi:MAG: hypothetical protein PHE24_02735 [Patescibacteria group bacterium]|nr:hypothetical protein [Patescibacteria group bacterium]
MFFFIKKIYHSALIFCLAVILSFFLFFLFLHPLNLVFFLGNKLSAATGINNSATVAVNPINQLALQLDEKEKQLNAREQALNDQEAQRQKQDNFWNSGLLLAIFLALGILAALVVLNFYFDRRREKELEILAQWERKEAPPQEEKKENNLQNENDFQK